MCILGSTVMVIHAPLEEEVASLSVMAEKLKDPGTDSTHHRPCTVFVVTTTWGPADHVQSRKYNNINNIINNIPDQRCLFSSNSYLDLAPFLLLDRVVISSRVHHICSVCCGGQRGPRLFCCPALRPEERAGLHPDLLCDWVSVCVLCQGAGHRNQGALCWDCCPEGALVLGSANMPGDMR